MAVNAAAPLFLTQALLGPLRAAVPKARIVIVSSDSGRFSVAKNGTAFPYRMSKAAVNMLTLNLAAALAADAGAETSTERRAAPMSDTETITAAPAMNFIAGEWRHSRTGATTEEITVYQDA